jgi:hypothetical protein
MLIAHRINRLEDLKALPPDMPIEFDVRESDYECTVRHDAFSPGESFSSFLPYLKTRFCIVNVKCEGLETYILGLFKLYGIENFFFLDCSIPMINRLTNQGETRIAVRWSEYETLESVRTWAGKVQWVWVDCFTRYPLTKQSADLLKFLGFKLCLVSPELQGRDADIEPYCNALLSEGIRPDAVCTKVYNFHRWATLYSSDESPSQMSEEIECEEKK